MRPIFALAIATLATGCIVIPADDTSPTDHTVYNAQPEIVAAEAGCYWDNAYYDDIWYFEADVRDADGVYDVQEVWADVYDDWSGDLIESFELFPTQEPSVWYSDWLGSTTWLDCLYDGYSVDIVAYDSFDDTDWVTVIPYMY